MLLALSPAGSWHIWVFVLALVLALVAAAGGAGLIRIPFSRAPSRARRPAGAGYRRQTERLSAAPGSRRLSEQLFATPSGAAPQSLDAPEKPTANAQPDEPTPAEEADDDLLPPAPKPTAPPTTEPARISPTIGVNAVILNEDGRVLLIKAEPSGWQLPGGQLEQGEDLLGALRREIWEEACCEAAVEHLAAVTSGISDPSLVMLTYRCTYLRGNPCAGHGSDEVGWFFPEQAMALVTHPLESLRLQDGLSDSPETIYRTYRRSESGAFELLGQQRWR